MSSTLKSNKMSSQLNEFLDLLPLESKVILESKLDLLGIDSWKLWVARWYVLSYIYPNLKEKKVGKLYNNIKAFHKWDDKAMEKALSSLVLSIEYLDGMPNYDTKTKDFIGLSLIIEKLVHYEAMGKIHNLKTSDGKKIISLPITFETMFDILDLFKNTEEEYHSACEGKSGKPILLENTLETEILFEYPCENFYWVDLKTAYCEDEALALGHCGMCNDSSNMYSLRSLHEKDGKQYYKAHVTLEVSEDNYLVQAKGKANTAPVKYKKYIQDFLIRKTEIEGVMLSTEESLALCPDFTDFDFLIDNIKRQFNFVDIFLALIEVHNDKIEWE